MGKIGQEDRIGSISNLQHSNVPKVDKSVTVDNDFVNAETRRGISIGKRKVPSRLPPGCFSISIRMVANEETISKGMGLRIMAEIGRVSIEGVDRVSCSIIRLRGLGKLVSFLFLVEKIKVIQVVLVL